MVKGLKLCFRTWKAFSAIQSILMIFLTFRMATILLFLSCLELMSQIVRQYLQAKESFGRREVAMEQFDSWALSCRRRWNG
ncbi:uncharacterized protein LOC143892512 isoform X4 [Tasmannia lanceolata]